MSDVVSLRDQTSPPALAADPDLPVVPDDDALSEIFLRVPPQPHTLLRASHVCRSWRRIVTDPNFLRTFRAHHHDSPPLLGVFHNNCYEGAPRFTPTGNDRPPASAAARVFSCPAHWRVLDCRHGRVLLHAARDAPPVLVLWDPLTRRCEQIQMPPEFMKDDGERLSCAVVCRAGGDADGRHRDCRASPFLVMLLVGRHPRALDSAVYSSESGAWSEVTSFDELPMWSDLLPKPFVVIGDTLYHPVSGRHTLSFDIGNRTFAVIPHPPETEWMDVQIMRLDGEKLGLVVSDNADFSLRLWARGEGAGDHWVLRWIVQLDTLEPLSAAARPGACNLRVVKLIGACEYGNVIFLWTTLGSFMFHLDTMQLKKLSYDNTMTSAPFMLTKASSHPCRSKVVVTSLLAMGCAEVVLLRRWRRGLHRAFAHGRT